MSAAIEYLVNKTSAGQIAEHLSRCDSDFVPPLSGRVEIETYSRKVASRATRFEAWSGGALVGLVAAYCNDLKTGVAYITSVSVLREWAGKGVAADLMKRCVEYARASGMRQISLEVAGENSPAIKLYKESGFIADGVGAPFVRMKLNLED